MRVILGRNLQIAVISVLFLACPLSAIPLTLSMSSLPSAQGWTFYPGTGSLTESQVFSVAGGLLHQDSTGGGSDAYAYNYFGAAEESPFSLYFRASLTGEEFSFQYFLNHNLDGFGAAVLLPDQSYEVGLGSNGIGLLDQTQTDNTKVITAADLSGAGISLADFHDYLLVGDPGSGTWQFYIDGTSWASGFAGIGFGVNWVTLGDETTGPNAVGDYAAFSYVPTPEPATIMLAGAGLACLRFARRRVKR